MSSDQSAEELHKKIQSSMEAARHTPEYEQEGRELNQSAEARLRELAEQWLTEASVEMNNTDDPRHWGPSSKRQCAYQLAAALAATPDKPSASYEEIAIGVRNRIVAYLLDRVKDPLRRYEEEEIRLVIQEALAQAARAAPPAQQNIALPNGLRFRNGGEDCDMLFGPCACGAWHKSDDLESRVASQLVAAPSEDTKRLDWLEEHEGSICQIEPPCCFPQKRWHIFGNEDDQQLGRKLMDIGGAQGKTLRAAIDAAMNAAKENVD